MQWHEYESNLSLHLIRGQQILMQFDDISNQKAMDVKEEKKK